MPPLKYSPKKITGSYAGLFPSGSAFVVSFEEYMDNTFVDIDYNEDAVEMHIGADGTATFTLNANSSGTATVTFVQGARANDLLSALVPNPRIDYMPTGTFAIKDLNGTSLVHDDSAVIARMAKVVFGKSVQSRPWKWHLPAADIFAGGAGT